ncbi:MAG TPA: hypothetical protein VMU68_02830, partial [Acidimicrobiales bacterium]|nr:hypothetical protein [Acidimicrobiales bacterium]
GNELRAVGAGCSILSPVTDLGPYFGTVVATRAGDEASLKGANLRFADALLETTREIIAGDREADVIEAAVRLLNLTEHEAQDHYECLRNPTTGLVESGRIDRASIATLVELRHSFSPTPELGTIIDAIDTVVLDRAIE